MFPVASYPTQGGDGGQFLPQAPALYWAPVLRPVSGCVPPRDGAVAAPIALRLRRLSVKNIMAAKPPNQARLTLVTPWSRPCWAGGLAGVGFPPLHHPDARYNGRPLVGLKMYQRTYASVTDVSCECGYLQRSADDPDVPIEFDQETNEFHFCKGGATLIIYRCPFCGGDGTGIKAIASHCRRLLRGGRATANLQASPIDPFGPKTAPQTGTDRFAAKRASALLRVPATTLPSPCHAGSFMLKNASALPSVLTLISCGIASLHAENRPRSVKDICNTTTVKETEFLRSAAPPESNDAERAGRRFALAPGVLPFDFSRRWTSPAIRSQWIRFLVSDAVEEDSQQRHGDAGSHALVFQKSQSRAIFVTLRWEAHVSRTTQGGCYRAGGFV